MHYSNPSVDTRRQLLHKHKVLCSSHWLLLNYSLHASPSQHVLTGSNIHFQFDDNVQLSVSEFETETESAYMTKLRITSREHSESYLKIEKC